MPEFVISLHAFGRSDTKLVGGKAAALGALHGRGIEPQIVFLEASDEVLVRRYSETRHRHPLDDQNDGVQSAIMRERVMLDEVRDMAQTTSEFNFDDSQLARTKDLISEIQTRIDVAEKLVNSEGMIYGEIPLEEDEQETNDVLLEMAEYFGTATPEIASVADTADSFVVC